MVAVAKRPCCLWAAQDAVQPLEALEREGIFARRMADLAAEHGEQKTIMIDAAI